MTKHRTKSLLLVPCAARKRVRPGPDAAALAVGTQAEVARQWLGVLRNADPVCRARDLYGGRAFGLSLAAATESRADLGILSAGLGPVHGDTLVPSYDLSAGRMGPASVRSRIIGSFDPGAWWRAVCAGPYASDFSAEMSRRPLVLVVLSRSYGTLALEAFRQAGDSLRLFGYGMERWLPADLRRYVMPYDERLETLGRPGTRADFGARALLDFVQHVLSQASDLDTQRSFVFGRMAEAQRPTPISQRRRMEDAGLREIISRIEASESIGATAMLRRLRRVEGIACEQKRFARLYREVGAARR